MSNWRKQWSWPCLFSRFDSERNKNYGLARKIKALNYLQKELRNQFTPVSLDISGFTVVDIWIDETI